MKGGKETISGATPKIHKRKQKRIMFIILSEKQRMTKNKQGRIRDEDNQNNFTENLKDKRKLSRK